MNEKTTQEVDQAKVEAFTEKIVDVLNGGALALMLSVGHRTHLFDTMATMQASTSEQIAAKAGLNERYVREWLGAMVTSRIVIFDPPAKTYLLPPEHAAVLTRAASPDNMAVTCQWIPVLAQVEDEILGCFQNGGGVHYAAFNRFHQTMAEESAQTVGAALLDNILPLVAGLPRRLQDGISALDIGCGAGQAVNRMAEAFPKSSFVGYDMSEEAIGLARDESKRLGLSNTRFEIQDVSRFEERATYDLITGFDTIHDQAKPAKVLEATAGALRADGIFLMQDIRASSHLEKNLDHPVGTFLYTISCMHCMTVSLAQGGAGLGTVWGEELALQMLRDAGFVSVEVKQIPQDIMNSYYVARKT